MDLVMSIPSERYPAAHQPRLGTGRFTFASHSPAEHGLLNREDATDEARQVFVDAQARAIHVSGHARRAGVNLLAVLAQAQDERAAHLALRWSNGRYTAENITDTAGDIVWMPESNGADPISRTVKEVGAYIEEPGDASDSGVRVLAGGAAILPLTPSHQLVFDGLDSFLAHSPDNHTAAGTAND